MIKVELLTTNQGVMPFQTWLDTLDLNVEEKVLSAITKLRLGHSGNTKSLGQGLYEYKIDFGPGYRLYFGKRGEELVILIGGGSKKRQQKDIDTAMTLWLAYKQQG